MSARSLLLTTQIDNGMPSGLPPEIIRLIIQNLVPDFVGRVSKQDLRSCSLVCHTWRHIAQPFIFINAVCEFSDGICPIGRLAQFRDFLQTSPAICASVRKLEIVSWGRRTHARVDTELCCSILSLLSRLQTVRLTDVYLTAPPSTLPFPRCRMPTVEIRYHNDHSRDDPDSLEDAIRLVGLFGEIDTLRVECSFLTQSGDTAGPTSYDSQTKVSAICTEMLEIEGVSGLVQALRYKNSLKALHMDTTVFRSEQDWEGLIRVLLETGVGSNLTHLGFSVGWAIAAGVEMHGELLRSCLQLETFTMQFSIATCPCRTASLAHLERNRQLWRNLAELVPSLPLTVKSIVLGLEADYPVCPYLRGAEEETAQIAAALVSRFGKSLPIVTFKSPSLSSRFDAEERECLKKLFPVLVQEEVIRFSE